MAGFFENLLSDTANGFTENLYLRDYQHASKTFRPNAYQYSPKFKFLFHVFFDINTDFIQGSQNWKDYNFGLAVKTVQLPKYTFDLTTLNQYNRKRVIQSKIKYDPVNITFHDDNGNAIRKLWYAYYSYYFKDPTQRDLLANNSKKTNNFMGPGPDQGGMGDINRRNMYDSDITGTNDWGYIGETSTPQTLMASQMGVSKAPFFRAINIYGFNQHNFVLYRLINPTIESFSHDTYDYAQGSGTMEQQMALQYETVKYYEGAVDGRTPYEQVYGFGLRDNYDTTLSPISRPGSNATILGQGGLVSAAGGILEDLDNDDILGAVQKAMVAKNTFKNPQNILKIAKNEVIQSASDYLKGTPNRNNVFNFPKASASDVASDIRKNVNGLYKTAKDTIIK